MKVEISGLQKQIEVLEAEAVAREKENASKEPEEKPGFEEKPGVKTAPFQDSNGLYGRHKARAVERVAGYGKSATPTKPVSTPNRTATPKGTPSGLPNTIARMQATLTNLRSCATKMKDTGRYPNPPLISYSFFAQLSRCSVVVRKESEHHCDR